MSHAQLSTLVVTFRLRTSSESNIVRLSRLYRVRSPASMYLSMVRTETQRIPAASWRVTNFAVSSMVPSMTRTSRVDIEGTTVRRSGCQQNCEGVKVENAISPEVLDILENYPPGEWTVAQHSEVKAEVSKLLWAAGIDASDAAQLVHDLCLDAWHTGWSAGHDSGSRI